MEKYSLGISRVSCYTREEPIGRRAHPNYVHVTSSENTDPGPHSKGKASLAFLMTSPVGAWTLTDGMAFPVLGTTLIVRNLFLRIIDNQTLCYPQPLASDLLFRALQ